MKNVLDIQDFIYYLHSIYILTRTSNNFSITFNNLHHSVEQLLFVTRVQTPTLTTASVYLRCH